MKVDLSWIQKQHALCKDIFELLTALPNRLNAKYNDIGKEWDDQYYQALGSIVDECNASVKSALQEMAGVLHGLEQMSSAVNEYLSINLGSGSSGSGSSSDSSIPVPAPGADRAVMAAGMRWARQLTDNQRMAVHHYTGSGYTNINMSLRGLSSFIPGNENSAIAIHEALSAAEIPCSCVVYRGASPAALGSYQDLSDEELVGCIIRDRGFMSTTLNQSCSFRGAVQFIISVPQGAHGAYVASISELPDEQEVLFDAMQAMEITGVTRNNYGERVIHAQMLI